MYCFAYLSANSLSVERIVSVNNCEPESLVSFIDLIFLISSPVKSSDLLVSSLIFGNSDISRYVFTCLCNKFIDVKALESSFLSLELFIIKVDDTL